MKTATEQAEELLRESLKALEDPKGSVLVGVQKLLRSATLLDDSEVRVWCEIQLGNHRYVGALKVALDNDAVFKVSLPKMLERVRAYAFAQKKKDGGRTKDRSPATRKHPVKSKIDSSFDKDLANARRQLKALDDLGLKQGAHYSEEEWGIKRDEAGGGYENIGFTEDKYASLIRNKQGNDGTYYQSNLNRHINYVRKAAHERATRLFDRIAFSNTPKTSIDILKAEVDGKLLDLAPDLAERLMLAFRSVVGENAEEWSQALTTCRRFIESLADKLYPPREEDHAGRRVGKEQYINRLWAFMDDSVESDKNRQLAKAHIDYLGSYLTSVHGLSHKGVHSNLTRIEAIKAVLHTYLMVADILDYLKVEAGGGDKRLNIHTASLDELESILGISRRQAKEIIRLRVEYGSLVPMTLGEIKGIGAKTISKAKELLSFATAK